jgi:hypothetical protein
MRFAIVLAIVMSCGAASLTAAQDAPRAAGPDQRVTGARLQEMLEQRLAAGEIFLLDVREPWELEKFGTIEGYTNIPIDQLEKRLSELPKDKAILTA